MDTYLSDRQEQVCSLSWRAATLYSSEQQGCPMSAFSVWLAQQMELHDASQRKIAAYTGLSPTTISNWLASKVIPSYESCVKISEYFRVPASEVLALAGYPPRPENDPEIDILDPELKLLFHNLQDLDEEGIAELKAVARFVLQRQREKEERRRRRKTIDPT